MKHHLTSAALFAAAMLLAPAVLADTAQLYKWTDAQGVVHYSDQPPKQPVTDLVTSDLPAFPAVDQAKLDKDQAALLAQTAALQQLVQAQAEAARADARQSVVYLPQPAVPTDDYDYSPAFIYRDSAFIPRAYRANLYIPHRSPSTPRPARSLPSHPAISVLQKP